MSVEAIILKIYSCCAWMSNLLLLFCSFLFFFYLSS